MTVIHDDMGGGDKPGRGAGKRRAAWVPPISHVTGLFLITSVCGFVDAACFLSLGQVFAEMMTGNLLLFCFYVGTGYPLFENVGYLVALAAFACGAITGGRINRGPLGDTRFGPAPYLARGGWVRMDLAAAPLDWDEVRELIHTSYCLIAPKTLARKVEPTER